MAKDGQVEKLRRLLDAGESSAVAAGKTGMGKSHRQIMAPIVDGDWEACVKGCS